MGAGPTAKFTPDQCCFHRVLLVQRFPLKPQGDVGCVTGGPGRPVDSVSVGSGPRPSISIQCFRQLLDKDWIGNAMLFLRLQ